MKNVTDLDWVRYEESFWIKYEENFIKESFWLEYLDSCL